MKLIWTHNNAQDTILLFDESAPYPVSQWTVEEPVLIDLLTQCDPDDWDVQEQDGLGLTVCDFGQVVAEWDGLDWTVEDKSLLCDRLVYFFGDFDRDAHWLDLIGKILLQASRRNRGVIA